MKIFGDDGFRDVYGKGLLGKKFLINFFESLNYVIYKKTTKEVVVGYDTRSTCKKILEIIKKKIISTKFLNIISNPISTPGLQFISKQRKAFGIMITASHFPKNYNGFKFFYNGIKISKKYELQIQNNINKKNNLKKFVDRKITYSNLNNYINFINKNLKFNQKYQILFDCSNGSIGSFYKKIKFLKNSKVINFKIRGNRINENCGTNFLYKNKNIYPYKKYDYCVAFDGDADRVLISKKNYGIIEIEKLSLIFAIYFKKRQSFSSIVATEIVNPWLKTELKKIKKKIFISKVGDRNVIYKKIKKKSLFGFETSGHFSFLDFMDGLYTAGLFLKILNTNPKIIDEVLKKNISFKKEVFSFDKKYLNKIKNLIKKNKYNSLKFIIRKSIWSKYYKIYFFYKQNSINALFNIKKILKNKIIKIKLKN